MTELDYLESIDQRLEAINEDTSTIVGEIPEYFTDLTYNTVESGEAYKYSDRIIELQQDCLQLTMINVIVTVLLLIYIFFVRVLK